MTILNQTICIDLPTPAALQWRLPARVLCAAAPSLGLEPLAAVLWSLAMQQHMLFPTTSTPNTIETVDAAASSTVGSSSMSPASVSSSSGSSSEDAAPAAAPQPAASSAAMTVLRAVLAQMATLDPRQVASAPHAARALAQGLSWLLFSSNEAVVVTVVTAIEQRLRPELVHVLRLAWLGRAASSAQGLAAGMHMEQDGTHHRSSSNSVVGAGNRPPVVRRSQRDEAQAGRPSSTQRTTIPDECDGQQGIISSLKPQEAHTVGGTLAWNWQQALGALPGQASGWAGTRADVVAALGLLGLEVAEAGCLLDSQAGSQQHQVYQMAPSPQLQQNMQQQAGRGSGAQAPELDSDQKQDSQRCDPGVHKISSGGANSALGRAAWARALLPLQPVTLVLLPHTHPRSVALKLTSRVSFAANVRGEPLGPLFAEASLLEQAGWETAVLDVGVWRSLGSDEGKLAYLEQLLKGCGLDTEQLGC